jgi:hypothetical protein
MPNGSVGQRAPTMAQHRRSKQNRGGGLATEGIGTMERARGRVGGAMTRDDSETDGEVVAGRK